MLAGGLARVGYTCVWVQKVECVSRW